MARVSIEDCLDNIDNRFALVKVASERARAIMGGEEPAVHSKNREAVTALREIAEGYIGQEVSGEDPAEIEQAEARAHKEAAQAAQQAHAAGKSPKTDDSSETGEEAQQAEASQSIDESTEAPAKTQSETAESETVSEATATDSTEDSPDVAKGDESADS